MLNISVVYTYTWKTYYFSQLDLLLTDRDVQKQTEMENLKDQNNLLQGIFILNRYFKCSY